MNQRKIKNKEMEIDFSNEIKAANENKTLNKPFRTPKGPKKFSVYVKNEKGNVVKVNFGDPNMEIKRDDPARRKSFRARHNCDNPGPKTKARYWSCRQWRGGKKVEGSEIDNEWDGETLYNQEDLLKINPSLADAEEVNECEDCQNDECEDCQNDESDAKKGLWHNIREKKKREVKNYRPAKPGDKDYPDEKSLKKAQESSKKKGKKK